MAGLGSVSFTSAQDPEMAAIERRRRLAEMLVQQAAEPMPVQQNAPISPLSGLAKALRGYTAGGGMRKADEAEKAYGEDYQKALATGLQGGGSYGDMAGRLEQTGNRRAMELAAQLRMNEAALNAQNQQKTKTMLTPEEVAAAGLPVGSSAQRDAYGGIEPIFTPKQATPTIPMSEQEIQDKIRIKQAGVQPPAPAPVTITQVVDPKNPKQLLQVDGRTYQPGGSIGDPGVLGIAPKLGEAAKDTAKIERERPQATIRRDTVAAASDRLISSLDELTSSPGLDNITGMLAGRTPTFSQEGRNAQALLENIKSRAFIDTLQAMRESSKTGGAVGNVSDREGDRLQNAAAALEQSQDTETFKRRLTELKQVAREAKERLQRAYDETYAESDSTSTGDDEGFKDL